MTLKGSGLFYAEPIQCVYSVYWAEWWECVFVCSASAALML